MKYIKTADEIGELRRELLEETQHISIQTQRECSRGHAKGAPLDNDQLLPAAQRPARFIQKYNVPSNHLGGALRRAKKMEPSGGYMLNREEAVCCSFQNYYCRESSCEARFRSQNGKYLPRLAVLVPKSLEAGIAPPPINQQVDDNLGVAGLLKVNTEKVLTVIF